MKRVFALLLCLCMSLCLFGCEQDTEKNIDRSSYSDQKPKVGITQVVIPGWWMLEDLGDNYQTYKIDDENLLIIRYDEAKNVDSYIEELKKSSQIKDLSTLDEFDVFETDKAKHINYVLDGDKVDSYIVGCKKGVADISIRGNGDNIQNEELRGIVDSMVLDEETLAEESSETQSTEASSAVSETSSDNKAIEASSNTVSSELFTDPIEDEYFEILRTCLKPNAECEREGLNTLKFTITFDEGVTYEAFSESFRSIYLLKEVLDGNYRDTLKEYTGIDYYDVEMVEGENGEKILVIRLTSTSYSVNASTEYINPEYVDMLQRYVDENS